jgi:hypothetical protein
MTAILAYARGVLVPIGFLLPGCGRAAPPASLAWS